MARSPTPPWRSVTEILKEISQGRFDAGLENATRMSRPSRCCPSPRPISFAMRRRARWTFTRHRRAGRAGRGGLQNHHPSQSQSWDARRSPLAAESFRRICCRFAGPIFWPPRRVWRPQCRDAPPRMLPSIPTSTLWRWRVSRPSAFPIFSTGDSFTMGIGPAVHLPIFDAGQAQG